MRMKKIYLIYMSTFLLVITSGLVHAEITVTVRNCMDATYDFCTFNPKDKVRVVSFNAKSVKVGEKKNLQCKGQGKGWCYVRVSVTGCIQSKLFTFHQDKNTTWTYKAGNLAMGEPVVQRKTDFGSDCKR